jgi:hypothetical protein
MDFKTLQKIRYFKRICVIKQYHNNYLYPSIWFALQASNLTTAGINGHTVNQVSR